MKSSIRLFTVLILAAGATAAGAIAAAAEPVISDFETGNEGWQIFDSGCSSNLNVHYGTYAVDHHASGGDPDGYISKNDPSSNCFFFAAPAKFLGDKSAWIGGRLMFSLRSTMSNWTSTNVVVLVGDGKVLAAEILPLPTTQWTGYSIGLLPTPFHYNYGGGAPVSEADFRAVMSDLTALRISGEYGSIVAETTGLDTVVMTPYAFPDINGDCQVNLLDLYHLCSQWLQAPSPPSADLYPDGIVDLRDYALFAAEWFGWDPDCGPVR